ncbi:hypothetical protein ACFYY2_07645 [Streptomyces sp. NPDC001822]|uniref:hypothetical protein n=1 Tax=Streptomyces sp. NPDC001822 TaxID=3364614 RepID=UPI0036C46361
MKTVAYLTCECSAKQRAYLDRRSAEKALGRAQAKRDRSPVGRDGGHPIARENRVYQCEYDLWHLTKQSRRSYEEIASRLAA